MSERINLRSLAASGDIEYGDGYRTKQSELGTPGIPILRVAEVLDGKLVPNYADHIRDEFRSAMGRKVSQPGDVILTTKGTVGRVAIMPTNLGEFSYSPQLCYFRTTKSTMVNGRFLYYWFKSEQFRRQSAAMMAQTDMAPYLNLNDIGSVLVDLPSFVDQSGIAEVLAVLDDKIAINDRILQTAEELAAAKFSRDFGEALALIGSDDTLLNSSGWRRTTLADVTLALESGSRPNGGVAAYRAGVPSVGAESVVGLARFDFSKVKFVPEPYYLAMKRGVLEDGDILLYKDGGRPGLFEPHVALFGDGFPFSRMCINEHVYRIRMKPPLSQEFGYFWLCSEPIMAEMRIRGTGVAIPGLNSTAAGGLPVVVPPSDRLAMFDAAAGPLVRRALTAANESQSLAKLRDALLPKLMSGGIRVREAERVVSDAV